MRSSTRPLVLATALLGVSALPATPAHAQPASSPETDRARELHRAGDAAFKAGKLEEARTAYLAAWALKKHWQIATNLGDAELRTGRQRDAAEHLAYALREGGGEMAAAQRDGVQKALTEAKTQVATVEVQIAPEGADVVVDGEFVGRSPLADPVFLAPGEHAIEVKRVGYVARIEKVAASAGAATTLRIELVAEGAAGAAMPPPAGSSPAPTPPSDDQVDDGPGVAPWFLIGGGAAVAIGGGVLLGVGLSEQGSGSDLLAGVQTDGGSCNPPSAGFEARCEEAFSSESTGNTLAGVGTALLIAGGAAIVGGAVWMVASGSSNDQQGVLVAPMVSHETAGLGAWGRF